MKALSVVAGLALTIVGTACSEQVPAEPENVAPAETATSQTASTGGSRFNLRIPGEEPSSQTNTGGGFNLRGPGAGSPSPASGPSAMQLPESARQADPLGDVPQVAPPALNNPAASVAGRDAPEAVEEDEDAIIRLD